ncbi:hypothetical protein [Methylobacterium terricola]|nr:hypothetical protein [Methylobacterium terricola]
MTKPLQVYLVLAAIYFIICFSLSRVVHLVEKRIDASRKAPVAAGGAA